MSSFAEIVDRSIGSPGGFGLGIVIALCAIAGAAKNMQPFLDVETAASRRRKWLCIAIMSAVVVSIFSALAILRSAANRELDEKMASGVLAVFIDGQSHAHPAAFAQALARQCSGGHHSHPTTHYQVVIQTRDGDVSLNIAEDSNIPQEFWVFYPKYFLTQTNDIRRACRVALPATG